MGLDIKRLTEKDVPLNFSKAEVNKYVKRFKLLDSENKGYISVNDLRRYFKSIGEKIPDDHLHEILREVDMNQNAQVDLGEFLQIMNVKNKIASLPTSIAGKHESQLPLEDDGWNPRYNKLMSAIEQGKIVNSRFALAAEDNEKKITVERSGGGV